ncbi:MAG: DUF3427 domain-containing protein [Eubacterium sp.]|nr:DUF3427 domain-containing protein [Eubacterium sp.]
MNGWKLYLMGSIANWNNNREFYYLGRMTATGNTNKIIMANTDKNAVEIEWKLDTPVRDDIYQYIVNG